MNKQKYIVVFFFFLWAFEIICLTMQRGLNVWPFLQMKIVVMAKILQQPTPTNQNLLCFEWVMLLCYWNMMRLTTQWKNLGSGLAAAHWPKLWIFGFSKSIHNPCGAVRDEGQFSVLLYFWRREKKFLYVYSVSGFHSKRFWRSNCGHWGTAVWGNQEHDEITRLVNHKGGEIDFRACEGLMWGGETNWLTWRWFFTHSYFLYSLVINVLETQTVLLCCANSCFPVHVKNLTKCNRHFFNNMKKTNEVIQWKCDLRSNPNKKKHLFEKGNTCQTAPQTCQHKHMNACTKQKQNKKATNKSTATFVLTSGFILCDPFLEIIFFKKQVKNGKQNY